MSGAVEGAGKWLYETVFPQSGGWARCSPENQATWVAHAAHVATLLTTPPARTYAEGEVERLTAERDFLRLRASHAGRCVFGGKRWTGESSNGLVDIAFGDTSVALPFDSADLASCYRLVQRLPAHLLSNAVIDHLERGEAFVRNRHEGGDDVAWARADAEWESSAHYRALASHLTEQGVTAS